MRIKRCIEASIEPTVIEVADVIWDMTSDDQISLLAWIDTRFFQIPGDGELQLGFMLNALQKQPKNK